MPQWNYSDEEHTLTFSFANKAKVICNVIIAGTTLSGRWQWSWGNRQTADVNRETTQPVLHLGQIKGWQGLTDLFRDADEYTGWECAAISSHLLGGQAVYRFAYGDNDEYFAYLVILRTQRVS